MAVGRVSAHKIGDESYNSIAGGGGQQERNSADIKIHRAVFICKSVRFEHQPYGERDSRKGEVCHQKAAARSEKVFNRAYRERGEKHRCKTDKAKSYRKEQIHIGQKYYQRISRPYCGGEQNTPTSRWSFYQKTCRRQHQKVDEQIYHQQYIDIYNIAHRAPPETV